MTTNNNRYHVDLITVAQVVEQPRLCKEQASILIIPNVRGEKDTILRHYCVDHCNCYDVATTFLFCLTTQSSGFLNPFSWFATCFLSPSFLYMFFALQFWELVISMASLLLSERTGELLLDRQTRWERECRPLPSTRMNFHDKNLLFSPSSSLITTVLIIL